MWCSSQQTSPMLNINFIVAIHVKKIIIITMIIIIRTFETSPTDNWGETMLDA